MKFLKIYLLLSLFFFSCKNESSSLVYIHSFQRTQTDKFIVKIKKKKEIFITSILIKKIPLKI
jgi:hypothetical protein